MRKLSRLSLSLSPSLAFVVGGEILDFISFSVGSCLSLWHCFIGSVFSADALFVPSTSIRRIRLVRSLF